MLPKKNVFKNIIKDFIGHPEGESDKYIYTNKRYFVPNTIRRLIRMKEIRPDRRKKKYGRIHAHLFHYITLPMVIITLGLLYVVTMNFEGLLVYFNTNIYLNGTIVSLMIFGILKVFHNSFLFFQTASFLRQLEKTANKEHISDTDILLLRNALEGKGALVNISAMDEVINHIEEFKYLNITDNQARFIKSKLGFRAGGNRKAVNFISGILVMLGLLGTFLGLLATIDAVGEALNSMANIGGDSGEIGMEEMTSFIGSLAAPLQGMGLAFSSSLFGLSGSLLIGFFLHLASTPQNAFIENVSRWIDDRIHKFDPRKLKDKASSNKEAEAMKPAKDADIKDWLAGYIYLSTQTHKQLTELSMGMSQMSDKIQAVSTSIDDLTDKKDALKDAVSMLSNNFSQISNHASDIKITLNDIQGLSHTMNSAMTGVDLSNNKIVGSLNDMSAIVSNAAQLAEKSANSNQAMNKNIPLIAKTLDEANNNNQKYANAFYKELKHLNTLKEEEHKILSEKFPSSYATLLKYVENIERLQGDLKSINTQERNENTQILQRIEQSLASIEKTNNSVINAFLSQGSSGIMTEQPTRKSFWKKN